MKKLFIEILLVVFSVVGLILLLEFLYMDYKSPVDYKVTKIQKNKSRITGIIIGNSHMEILGNPNVFENDSCVVNLSMGGQDLYHMLLFIEKVIPESPKLKYVLVGLDYELIGYSFTVENQAWKDRLYYSFNLNIYDQSLSNILMAQLNFFKANRDLSYIFSVHKYSEEEHTLVPPIISKTENGCKKRALDHSLYKYKKNLIKENLEYLEKIVSICKKYKVEIICINTPKTKCYSSFYRPEVIQTAQNEYHKFFVKNQLIYLDLFNSEMFTEDDFIDYDHLNEKGTKKLILQIRNKVK